MTAPPTVGGMLTPVNVTNTTTVPNVLIVCTDGDGGFFPELYGNGSVRHYSGSVQVGGSVFADTCINNINLTEYWCASSSSNVTATNVQCAWMCQNGTCVNQTFVPQNQTGGNQTNASGEESPDEPVHDPDTGQ